MSSYEDVSVAELMSERIVGCPRDANLGTVAAELARHRVHAVFVLDDAGRPAGVVTDFDLLAGEWLGDDAEGLRTMQAITAGELMTSPVETIGAEARAAQAAARMRELHLSRLLVVDGEGSAVGVIAVSDLVAGLGEASDGRRCVRDVMSAAIVTCPAGTSVRAAARAMTERRSRSIVVVDDEGRAVGVITGSDLLALYQPGEHETTVAELMRAPITCDAELSLSQAADLMIKHEVHRIVVTDASHRDRIPIGIVSTSDIVAEMAHEGSVWQQTRDRS